MRQDQSGNGGREGAMGTLMAHIYVITTDRGGPLYFRDSRAEAEALRATWQADLHRDAGCAARRVTVDREPASDDEDVLRDGFSFLQHECSHHPDVEACLERMRVAFERMVDAFEQKGA